MAVVAEPRVGCDGCGRTVTLEELTTVTMPDGRPVLCCPECEPHARAAARTEESLEQRRRPCDGCTAPSLVAELEDVVLEDGTVLRCCPSCAAEAPGRDGDDGPADGGAEDTRSTVTAEDTRTAGTTETDDTDDRALCTQCTERVSDELFRVTTIDERTERLCPDCKADAEERGIVAAVEMRRTRAREVLGVDADAAPTELRDAYHRQVKRAHPDRQSGSRSAFELVTDAYERLREDD